MLEYTCEHAWAGWCVLWCVLSSAAVTACTPCVFCGCVRLVWNKIGDEGCTSLAGALVHVPSLTTLEYVG